MVLITDNFLQPLIHHGEYLSTMRIKFCEAKTVGENCSPKTRIRNFFNSRLHAGFHSNCGAAGKSPARFAGNLFSNIFYFFLVQPLNVSSMIPFSCHPLQDLFHFIDPTHSVLAVIFCQLKQGLYPRCTYSNTKHGSPNQVPCGRATRHFWP